MPAETETARKYHIVGDYATALNPRNDARSVEKYARHLVLRPHGARIHLALSPAPILVLACGALGGHGRMCMHGRVTGVCACT